ncbi:RING finger ubiquitin ligase [Moesziomyces antarcticus]|uniref:RING-type E3 ubiquitin transferase n=2 Tax=Pseudozyma antarctica TaxID=84753 RepID=A0A081CD95_PSEA2|nr:RING finger ubiquitin ligase [Moesziomyces antarcticus]GAK64641.1 RING finger ubiquitin ligase [Moesziomyces antarcticus]SPO45623.1 related to TUL1 - Golgi-localized RING-finger ubiquitin ligase [Moesziomyces antarcticus]
MAGTSRCGPGPGLGLWLAIWTLVLTTSVHASFLGTLLFGKDTLEPVREAIRQTEHMRSQVYGWYHHNATEAANFSVTPDPAELYTLLPATYSGRSLVTPDGAYYRDIEGYYKGSWSGWDMSTVANRSLAIDSRLNRTAAERLATNAPPQYLDDVEREKLVQDRGAFDWLTVDPGHMDLHLQEEHLLKGNVSLVTGSLSFSVPKSEKSTDFSLEGLHYIPTGSIFLHAMGDEAVNGTDVRTVLGMVPRANNATANATVAAIDKAFQLRIDMLERIIASGSYDAPDASSTGVVATHNCSLHVYAQLRSAGAYDEVQVSINALEREMAVSTGISTIAPPALQLSMLAYSPECRFVASAKEVTGLLQSRVWKKAVRYALMYMVVVLVQTWLLVQQMEATTTPSGLGKLSDKTFLAQSVLDAYSCLVHLSVGVALDNETTVPLIACAFMSGMCFMAFGYRYTITIYRTHMDAAPTPAPTPAPATPAPAPSTATAPGSEGQPIPVDAAGATATQPQPAAVETPEERTARRRGRAIFGVGFFLMMVAFFPLVTVAILLPIVYSFWVPQIWRNVERGTRKAILTRCVVGTTLARLFVPLYVLLCPANVLMAEPSAWGYVLGAYVVVQMLVLLGQDVLGPHFFLRAAWVPEHAAAGWEYHPAVGGVDAEQGGGAEYGDCAICLAEIEDRAKPTRRPSGVATSWWPFGRRDGSYGYDRVAEAEEFEVDEEATTRRDEEKQESGWAWMARFKPDVGAAGALRRRRMDVMVAPCQHAFHTECLERWLTIKNECPSCRSMLPPV